MASRTETSSSPGSPHTTRAPRSRSTVLTSRRFGELGEGDVRDRARHELAERLFEIDRRGAHPLEQHPHVVDAEQVALAQRLGARGELLDRRAADVRRADQRADARAGEDLGDDVALRQRAQHADVREPLEATAAEDERDASAHGCSGRTAGTDSASACPPQGQMPCPADDASTAAARNTVSMRRRADTEGCPPFDIPHRRSKATAGTRTARTGP